MAEEGHPGEPTSPEDILDQLGCFEPAESLFDASVPPPDRPTPPDPAADLESVMELLAQLQQTGAPDVGDALAQVRDALAPIAGVIGTPPRPATPPPPPAEGDVELECEFDSVSDVLEGVFGQAAIVADAATEASVYVASSAADATVVAEAPAAPPVVEPAPGPVVAEPAVPEPDVPDPPVDVTPADDDGELDRILSSIGGDMPASIETPTDATPVVPNLPHDTFANHDRPTAGSAASRFAELLPPLAAVTLVALTWINFPLRFVPPRLRVAVDWLALTLVFWVPIVWVIAWLA